MILIESR